MKDINAILKLRKGNSITKGIVIKGIRTLFELKEEDDDHCKPVITKEVCNGKYVKYEGNGAGNREKLLSLDDYLEENIQYLNNISNSFKSSDNTSMIQWTVKEEMYNTMNSYYKYTSISKSPFYKVNILPINTEEKYLKYSIHFVYIWDYKPLWI